MRKRWAVATILVSLVTLGAGAAVVGQYKGFPTVRLVINGREVESDVPPLVLDGRTMLPVRAVADALGLQLGWDETSRTVTLTGASGPVSPNKGSGFASASTKEEFGALATQTQAQLSQYQGIILVLPGAVVVTDPTTFFDYANQITTMDEFLSKSKSIQVPAANTTTSPSPATRPAQPAPSIGLSGKIQVVGQDNQFLGYLTSSEFNTDSICNKYGSYGSEFSSTSIFNTFGQYGGSFSSKSAFNDLASQPPMLVKDGNVIGYLTTNRFKQGAISPIGICQTLKESGL